MDSVQFGQFIADLRKQHGMTQKELAARLNVTDKAVSRWETGKGFPDIKLLEDLARALDVTLVELIRCQRQDMDHLTVAEAGEVVCQAMDQVQQVTTRRYLRLLRWLLIFIGIMAIWTPLLNLIAFLLVWHLAGLQPVGPDMGIIGGADGPTAILVARTSLGDTPGGAVIACIIALICLVLALRVRRLEKRLH